MVGLCTNVLLRWLLDGSVIEDDAPGQRAAIAELLGDKSRRFFVNDVVVAETAWIVRKRLKQEKAKVADMVDRLMSSSNIEVERPDILREAVRAYLAGPADLADELIAHVNREAGCSTTLTFDKDAGRSPLFTLLS